MFNVLTLQVGFSHSDILKTIILLASSRYPGLASQNGASSTLIKKMGSHQESQEVSKHRAARKVFVIFGGETSERQVSLMSGTNVWLNLLAFDDVSMQALNKSSSFLYG